MIVHRPWVGEKYKTGFESSSQRLAIAGYSSYGDDDHEDVTVDTIALYAIDQGTIPFYNKIAGYFGYINRFEFWNSVSFFNFVPNNIGSRSNMFGVASAEQVALGNDRFTKIVGGLDPTVQPPPDKVFVFSTKTRQAISATLHPQSLGAEFPEVGHISIYDGRSSQVYFLRHPQGATFERMRRAVQHILALR